MLRAWKHGTLINPSLPLPTRNLDSMLDHCRASVADGLLGHPVKTDPMMLNPVTILGQSPLHHNPLDISKDRIRIFHIFTFYQTHNNPYPARIIYLIFQPLEVVSRCRDPQPQVVENYSYLFYLRPNIYKFLFRQ